MIPWRVFAKSESCWIYLWSPALNQGKTVMEIGNMCVNFRSLVFKKWDNLSSQGKCTGAQQSSCIAERNKMIGLHYAVLLITHLQVYCNFIKNIVKAQHLFNNLKFKWKLAYKVVSYMCMRRQFWSIVPYMYEQTQIGFRITVQLMLFICLHSILKRLHWLQ